MKLTSIKGGRGAFKQGVIDCVPTLLGYFSIGFAAGIVEKTAGLSLAEIALLCLLLYAGSGQFILAGMITSAFSTIAVVITIFFVNLRHLLFSAALSPYFRNLPPVRSFAIGALLTDESFGVASGQISRQSQLDERWMHGLNITAYLGWFIANMAGAFFGQWIDNPMTWGMDFALPGMFIGLLVLQMSSRKMLVLDLSVALIAIVAVIAAGLLFSSSVSVIVATLVGATCGVVMERWKFAARSSS